MIGNGNPVANLSQARQRFVLRSHRKSSYGVMSTLAAERRGKLESTLQMLDHFPAGLGAVSARFRAFGHVLVVGEFLAGCGTFIATLRTAVAGVACKWAHAGAESGCQLAAVAAVHAQLRGDFVFLLPLREQRAAVGEAHIALQLAIRTGLRALGEVSVVVGLVVCTLD